MRLIVNEHDFNYDPENDFDPEQLLTLLKGTRLGIGPRRAEYTGVCSVCSGWAQHWALLGEVDLAVLWISTCEKVIHTGFERYGFLRIDWAVPDGPYIKKAVIQISEKIFLEHFNHLDALITFLDNIKYHSETFPDMTRRHFGGTVTQLDRELGTYEVIIRIA